MTSYTQSSAPLMWSTPLFLMIITNFIWIHLSEVFRYFVFIMPMMREALSMVPDVALMNLSVFMIWGVWDTILVAAATFIPWLVFTVFGGTVRNAIIAGTGVWMTVFGILWLGVFNVNLATPEIVLTALSLAWLEMIVASLVVWWFCFSTQTTLS